jgi:hypothetical protein
MSPFKMLKLGSTNVTRIVRNIAKKWANRMKFLVMKHGQ